MTTWHPPIPANKLYSPDALDLGPALAMLIWCYDRINRDGTIEVQLPTVTTDIGKPYGTIKDWWRMLRAGPFFCEQIDRGKKGWVVRMAEDWVDWHVMANNYPSRSGESRDVNLDENGEGPLISLEELEGAVKAASKQRQSRDVNLEKSAYKEDQQDQRSESHGGSEDRDGTARTHPPAVATLFEVFPEATISVEQTVDLCSIGNLALWREVLVTWRANGYKPRIGNLLDRYLKDLAKVSRNGTHQSNRPARAHSRAVPERYDTD